MITGTLWHGPFSLQMFTRDTRKTHPCRWTRGCILCIMRELFLWCIKYHVILDHVYSLRLNDTNMHQLNIPALLQIMAYCLLGAKPLPEPNAAILSIRPLKKHISAKYYFKFKSFHSRKLARKCCLQNGGHFVSASMCVNSLRLSDASMHQ